MFDDENIENWIEMCRSAKWTQYSNDCYSYGLLAMGWADIVVEQCLGLHDVIGIAPIITGAGGYIADFDGNPITARFNGQAVAASHKALADQALAVLLPHKKQSAS